MQKQNILFFAFCLLINLAVAQNTPTTVAGLKIWLKADSNTVLSGSNVSQWNDCSGNGYNAIQTTVNYQPLWVNAIINSKPVIRFDGNDDYMIIDPFILAQPITVFAVWSSHTNPVGSATYLFDGIDGTNRILFNYNDPNSGYLFYAGVSNYINTTAPPFTKINSLIYNTSSSKLYDNGTLKGTVNTGTNSLTGITLGSNSGLSCCWLDGDIAEIIIYDQALPDSSRRKIEEYLNLKYVGPPVNLGPDININYGFCDTTITNLSNPANFIAYQWSTGATTSSITVNQNGVYSVTATNTLGFITKDSVNVLYPSINLRDTFFCAGSGVTLNPQMTGIYIYSWSTSETTSAINVSSAGQYSVTVSDACGDISKTINVTRNDFSVIARLASGNDTSLCSGNKIALIEPSPLPSGLSYNWSTGYSTSSINITSTGPYILTVTNDSGCVARDSIYVTIIGTAPVADFSYGSQCSGNPVTFTDLSTSGVNKWHWDFGDGDTSNVQNPSHLFSAGTYTVSLTATSGGCSKDTSKQIIIKQSPTAYFKTNTACINLPYQFNDESVPAPGDPITGYYWDFADGTTSNIANPQHTYTIAGTYTVTLTINTTLGCTTSFSKPIIIVATSSLPESFDLVFPGNNSIVGDNIIDFVWGKSKNATHYKIQVATDPAFSNIISFADTIGTEKTLNITEIGQLFFWRVKAYNICNDEIISNTFKFTLFTPRLISCAKLWLSADSGAVVNVDSVYEWIDRSGSNNDATQSLANKKPLLVNNVINNKPVVRFDGTDDYMLINPFVQSQPITVIAVWSVHTNPVGSAAYLFDGIGMDANRILFNYNDGHSGYDFAAGIDNYINVSPPPFTKINSLIYNTTSSRLYENGILKGTVSVGTNSLTGITIGAPYNLSCCWLDGDIAEMIVYCSSLNDSDRTKVEQYLDYKYAGPPVCLGEDINIPYGFCDTTLKDIFNPSRFTAYQWSTTATTSSIKVNETGYYSVTATNVFGRKSVDTVKVNFPKWNLNDTAFCVGGSVTLNSQLGTSDYTYSWSTGPTTSAITVSSAGIVYATITDNVGCSVKDTINVSVDNFSVTTTLGPDVAFCMGDSLGLFVGELPGNHYLWSPGGATTSKIKVTSAGTYSVTVTNYLGCVATDAIDISTKGYAPVANFSALAVCIGDITNFINSSTVQSPNTINTWDWDFGDASPHSSSQNPVHTYANPGTYTVTLTVTTNVGCVNSIIKKDTVYYLPQANFSPVNGCTGVEISFDDGSSSQSGSVYTWSWNFGDPTSGT
ncbi:MAG: PKD domain-containing protein, partial [Bacteroidales bacterium]|nr:PKD domain-containing protein [Bacteroidales bacterium]